MERQTWPGYAVLVGPQEWDTTGWLTLHFSYQLLFKTLQSSHYRQGNPSLSMGSTAVHEKILASLSCWPHLLPLSPLFYLFRSHWFTLAVCLTGEILGLKHVFLRWMSPSPTSWSSFLKTLICTWHLSLFLPTRWLTLWGWGLPLVHCYIRYLKKYKKAVFLKWTTKNIT